MYSLLTWGSMISKWQINDLLKLQKECVQITCGKPINYNSKLLFESEHIPALQDLIQMESAKFGYKISCNLAPKPIQLIMADKGGKKHTNMKQETNQHLTSNSITLLSSIVVFYVEH